MDKFKIIKKGYDKDEVDACILRLESSLENQKDRIESMLLEIGALQAELNAFRQKESLIAQSLMSAAEKAQQIEAAAKQKYTADMENLAAFHEQWITYYKKLMEKYPLDEELISLNEFNENISTVLNSGMDEELVRSETEVQFKRENDRLKRRYGYLHMGDDDDELEFNPEESIRALLRRQSLEEEQKKTVAKPAKKRKKSKDEIGASNGESDTFSYEDALNPKQSLSEILQDLGIDVVE